MTGDRPLVSVVIPVRDDAERLRACLDALAAQTYPAERMEVWVVDNGSREDPVAVCADRPGVRLLSEPRWGSYAARNAGIAAARGEMLAFTDSDCLPEPDWLARGVDRLQDRPDAGFVGGRVEMTYADPARPTPAEIYDRLIRFPQEVDVLRNRRSVTANVLIPRAVLDAVGPFRAELESGGDLELTRRISDAGFAPVYGPDVVVRHPARRTMRELIDKQRRIARGQVALATTHAGGGVMPGHVGPLLRKYSTFLWTESRTILRSPREPSLRRRWVALSVNLLVRLTGLQTVLAHTGRRALRATPERIPR